MKIGIIVHSQTGNTYSVAEKLKEKLSSAGHSANIERITSVGDPQKRPVQLGSLPDLSPYDAFVFAAPVQAFSISAAMGSYMKNLPALNGKKAALFVTKGLPFKWTGGSNAISQMKSAVESRGGTVIGSAIMTWGGEAGRDKKIADLVEQLSGLFK